MDPQYHNSHLDEGRRDVGMEEKRTWQGGGKEGQRERRRSKGREGGGKVHVHVRTGVEGG